MVVLSNPQPATPVEGGSFTITAREGSSPYTFEYQVNDDELETRNQSSSTLVIPVPENSSPAFLKIKVTDSNLDEDDWEKRILAKTGT